MSAAEYKLSELAEKLGVEMALGDGYDDMVVTGINTLEEAGPSELSFLSNPKYTEQLKTTGAGAVIVRPEHASDVKRALVADEPYEVFARVLNFFARPQGSFRGVSHMAHIDRSAVIGEDCSIYPFVFIGPRVTLGSGCRIFPGCYIGEDCVIGEGCTLYPHVTLMAGTVVGPGCVFHPGVVIGAEGFGFIRSQEGISKIPQIGIVEIGSHVEIGANSAVDRAALSRTAVGDGTCIDNLVQIGHNVRMGKNCLIVAQVGIAGSTHVGDNVTMAGQAGLSGHLHVGSNCTIGPQAGVAKDLPDGKIVSGTPTMDYNIYLRMATLMPKIPDLFKRVSSLEKELGHKPAENGSRADRSLLAMWNRWMSKMHRQ